jgi:hypothetical protein
MKITLPRIAPRNPLVQPSRQRRAGLHVSTPGGQRQKSAREVRRELERMSARDAKRPPPDSP